MEILLFFICYVTSFLELDFYLVKTGKDCFFVRYMLGEIYIIF